MIEIGLVGKPNTGKTTFFSAATLVNAKIAPYPFTTIDSNKAIGYVRIQCVCKEFGVKDNPVNSFCIDGNRFIPIKIIDVAGLVPNAWKGRGLGNRFLDKKKKTKVLIHVIDASGSTDSEGKIVPMGSHNPAEDVQFLEKEIDMWIFGILKKDWERIARRSSVSKENKVKVLLERLSGLEISQSDIDTVLKKLDLESKNLNKWNNEDIKRFVSELRRLSKPILIAANKADLPVAEDNIEQLKEEFGNKYVIIPTSAISELALRKAAKKKLIKYLPGDSNFTILEKEKLSKDQLEGLNYIKENILRKWKSTGIQSALNAAVFKVLKMIAVFPVEDENKLTDHYGRVLPDVFLVPKGMKVKDFAFLIHSELGKGFIHAIDARNKKLLSADYLLRHRDVIKIVSRI